ncbi:MAG TPA: HNH endonuclease [Dokdonella sp.]|uniref:HNH endonuclease n=1 Tax=Dokdonella sp. TaxID=2291710 RepID=UPI002BE10F3B|nr:HNH endonuclease [Dokdonella sp.]HUD43162.1 HNH endonuclease [Dokdonella sp.]
MDSRENEEFTSLLRGAVGEAEKLKYRPTTFKRMLDEHGGFETVNRVLASGKPSDGFTKLWELGRLDLTCEAIIVETKWRHHFDANLLAKAEKLLGEMRYPFKRFEDSVADVPQTNRVSEESAATERHIPDLDGLASEPLSGTGMRINAFFKDVLNAPVANVRWSWGAADERTRRVFLRLWRMDIANWDGGQVIRVLGNRNTNRPGWNERARHLELIRDGYQAYGVVCDKDSPEAGVIRDFDRDSLLHLGRVVDRDGMVYLEIAGIAPVYTIAVPADSSGTLISDLHDVDEAEVSATTRAALVDARLGQGRFRRELLRRWNGACAVTGCRVGAVLRASHCKPWSRSEDYERLDSNNGLILSANLDALFDAGLISFGETGKMLVSDVLSTREQDDLGLPARLLRNPNAKLAAYLRYHRDHVFQG